MKLSELLNEETGDKKFDDVMSNIISGTKARKSVDALTQKIEGYFPEVHSVTLSDRNFGKLIAECDSLSKEYRKDEDPEVEKKLDVVLKKVKVKFQSALEKYLASDNVSGNKSTLQYNAFLKTDGEYKNSVYMFAEMAYSQRELPELAKIIKTNGGTWTKDNNKNFSDYIKAIVPANVKFKVNAIAGGGGMRFSIILL